MELLLFRSAIYSCSLLEINPTEYSNWIFPLWKDDNEKEKVTQNQDLDICQEEKCENIDDSDIMDVEFLVENCTEDVNLPDFSEIGEL
jgi:hypothetical protein